MPDFPKDEQGRRCAQCYDENGNKKYVPLVDLIESMRKFQREHPEELEIRPRTRSTKPRSKSRKKQAKKSKK